MGGESVADRRQPGNLIRLIEMGDLLISDHSELRIRFMREKMPVTYAAEPDSSVSLQDYVAIFRRRRKVMLMTFLIVMLIAVICLIVIRPMYEGTTQLLVDDPSAATSSIDTSDPLSSLLIVDAPPSIDTQVGMLQTDWLLNAAMRQAGEVRFDVSVVKGTNIIAVSADSTNPRTASDAANALVSLYLQSQEDQQLDEIRSMYTFVSQQGDIARRKLIDADAKLLAFKQQHHVTDVGTDQANMLSHAVALEDDYERTQSDLRSTNAEMAVDEMMLNGERPTVSYQVANTNTNIQGLQDDIVKLEVQRQGMTQPGGFLPAAPQIRAIDAQIAALKQQMASQPKLAVSTVSDPNNVREQLRSEVASLKARQASLQSKVTSIQPLLTAARAAAGQFATWESTLARLAGTRDDDAAIDKMFVTQKNDLSLREKAYHATDRVIQAAGVPDEPLYPRKWRVLLYATLAGLFLAGCIALLLEYFDDRVTGSEEGERLLGLPTLGRIPAIVAGNPLMLAQVAESYRQMRTNLHFASLDAPNHTLALTSSETGEGKTTTAINLASAMVLDGKSVILVDADLRSPSLHEVLGLPVSPGLTDVLLGTADLSEALATPASAPKLHILTSGTKPPNPAELTNSRTFRELKDRLSGMADLVIFDCPPVFAAESQILASQVDGTIMVVQESRSRKRGVLEAATQLRNARANVLGVVYNRSTVEKKSYYYPLPGADGALPTAEAENPGIGLPVLAGRSE